MCLREVVEKEQSCRWKHFPLRQAVQHMLFFRILSERQHFFCHDKKETVASGSVVLLCVFLLLFLNPHSDEGWKSEEVKEDIGISPVARM